MDNEIKQQLEVIQADALKALNGMRDEWKKHYEELKAQGAPVADITEKIERALKRLDAVEANLSRPVGGDGVYSGKTIGEIVVGSEATQELAKQIAGAGWVRGRAATIPIKSFFLNPELKTTITSAAVGSSTPGILVPERMPGIVKPGVRRLRVRDLMPRFPTSNNAVEFVKENAFTNAASPTAETISKPESALTFAIDSATVKTIATWIPAAKQVLDDFAALQSYINQRLLEGLMDIEDYELVGGDGTGQHISGLTTEATAYDTALNASGDTYIDKINHAIGQMETVLQAADGIILNPADWRTMNGIKDQASNVGNYILGGPANLASPSLWGLPVATTTAVPVGQFFVGAFQQYTAVWDRMSSQVDISTEHADYFIRNMVAIRAEERIAFTVTRADAVIFGSL